MTYDTVRSRRKVVPVGSTMIPITSTTAQGEPSHANQLEDRPDVPRPVHHLRARLGAGSTTGGHDEAEEGQFCSQAGQSSVDGT